MAIKVLVACEESQTVCKALRNLGHNAFSCDILPSSGGHPEWHFNSDVFKIINSLYNCSFKTHGTLLLCIIMFYRNDNSIYKYEIFFNCI